MLAPTKAIERTFLRISRMWLSGYHSCLPSPAGRRDPAGRLAGGFLAAAVAFLCAGEAARCLGLPFAALAFSRARLAAATRAAVFWPRVVDAFLRAGVLPRVPGLFF